MICFIKFCISKLILKACMHQWDYLQSSNTILFNSCLANSPKHMCQYLGHLQHISRVILGTQPSHNLLSISFLVSTLGSTSIVGSIKRESHKIEVVSKGHTKVMSQVLLCHTYLRFICDINFGKHSIIPFTNGEITS